MGDTKYLSIESISKENTGGKVTLTASLCSSAGIRADLWYSFDREFDDAVCDDRCDAVVTTLLLAAMKFGYEELRAFIPFQKAVLQPDLSCDPAAIPRAATPCPASVSLPH